MSHDNCIFFASDIGENAISYYVTYSYGLARFNYRHHEPGKQFQLELNVIHHQEMILTVHSCKLEVNDISSCLVLAIYLSTINAVSIHNLVFLIMQTPLMLILSAREEFRYPNCCTWR